MLGIIIAVICLIKGIESLKDSKHDKFCAITFIIFSAAWILTSIGGTLITLYIPMEFNLISLLLMCFIILYAISGIMGIISIAKFDSSLYRTGQKQAGSVIALSILFSAIQFYKYNNMRGELNALVNESVEQISYVFEDKNYSFELPENSNYKALKSLDALKDADFVLKHDNNKYFFMMVSENIGIDSGHDTKSFLDAVMETQKSSLHDFKEIESNTVLLNGLPAQENFYTAKVKKFKFLYHSISLVHNGMYYAMTTYTFSPLSPKEIRPYTKKMSKYFNILDKNKKFYSEDIKNLEKFSSKIAPYELDLSKSENWFTWDELFNECPESEFGGRNADQEVSFCTSSLKIDTSKYPQETLANAMLRDFEFSLADEEVTFVKKNEEKPYSSYTVKASRVIDSIDYDYFFKVYFTPNSVFRVVVWGEDENVFTAKAFDDILKQLVVKEQDTETSKEDLETLANQQSELWNYLGVILHNLKKYQPACECYLKAHHFNKERKVVKTNYFLSLNFLKKYDKIIEFLEKRPKLLEDAELLSWLAYSRKQLGQTDESLKNYYTLFSKHKDYSNDNDFIDYMSLLINQNSQDVIKEISGIYLNDKREETVFHDLINLYIRNDFITQAKEQLDALPEAYKETIETKRLTLKYLISAGDFKAADKSFQALLKDGHRDLTTLYTGADLYYDIGWYSKAKETLQELLKIAPNDKDGKELMDLTLSYLGEGDKGNTIEKIEAVALPQAVQEKLSNTAKSGIEGDIKYNFHITSYSYENKRLKKTIYRKFTLGTSKGIKDNSTIYYTYSPNNSSIYVNKLTVTSPDGSSVTASDRNAFYLTEADDDQASEDKTLCMPVSALEPGCTVEYTLTESFYGNYDFFPFKRHWLTLTVPYELTCISISGDIDKVSYKLNNSDLKIIQNDKDLIFAQDKEVIYKSEPESVDAEKNYPIVYIGNKTESWKSEVSEYYEKIKKKLIPSPNLRPLVESIIKGASTSEEKVRLLTYYIQDNITYKAIEFGTRGIIPDLPEKVLKQKYGDCKDVSVLLCQMLKTIGIKSTLTLVSTDYELQSEIADLDQFDHMILYVNDLNAFVDCTLKDIDILTLGNVYNNDKKVLFIDQKEAEIKKIPYQPVKSNTFTVNREISLNPDNSLSVNEEVIVKDYYAYFIRKSLKSKDEEGKKEKLKNFINYWPDITEFKGEIENLDDRQKDLVLKLSYKVNHAINKLNEELNVNLTSPWLMYYFGVRESPDRFSPFQIYYDIKMISHTRFKTAPGSKITFNPVNHTFNEAFAVGSVKAEKDNDYISVKIESSLNKGAYPAKLYDKYFNSFKKYINTSNIHFKINQK